METINFLNLNDMENVIFIESSYKGKRLFEVTSKVSLASIIKTHQSSRDERRNVGGHFKCYSYHVNHNDIKRLSDCGFYKYEGNFDEYVSNVLNK